MVVFSPVHSHEVEIDCHQAQQVAYGDRAIAKRAENPEYQALATQFASMVRTTDDVYLRFHPEQSLSRVSN